MSARSMSALARSRDGDSDGDGDGDGGPGNLSRTLSSQYAPSRSEPEICHYP